jgi:signal transduction histidine kinase
VIEDVFLDGKLFETTSNSVIQKPGIRPSAASLSTENVLRVPPGKHQFDFHFTALSFTAPDKVRFRYKLTGFDNSWNEADTKRSAHYGPLRPGDYRFQVIACNNDGVWNEQGAAVSLTVLPYFWETWWFDSLVGMAIVGTIFGIVYFAATHRLRKKLERLRQQHAIERERERIARDIHDDLGAGLTQIMLQSALAGRDAQGQTQGDLMQISETSRHLVRTMDEIVWAINPENDTLDSLVTYLGKFVQEYLAATHTRCRLDLPIQVPVVVVPSEVRHNVFLAVKEILNNVIKHAQATEVSFQLKIQPAAFVFIVNDNGRGFTPGVAAATAADDIRIASGNGLRNLSKRMEEIGGVCTVTSGPGKGTQVELTILLNNRSANVKRHQPPI